MARTRITTSASSSPGASVWHGSGSLNGNYAGTVRESTCIDVSDGTRINHPLDITHNDTLLYTITGRSSSSSDYWDYNGRVVAGNFVNPGASTAEPSDNTSLSTALARTNPNRPWVDAPVFLWELKDIPSMVKNLADISRLTDYVADATTDGEMLDRFHALVHLKDVPRFIAERNLEWEFGWRPFFSDLAKLLNFQRNVDKKVNMLRRMSGGQSVGGIAVTWEDVARSAPSTRYLTGLYQESNVIQFQWETTRRKWVSCVWRPSKPMPMRTDTELQKLAERLTFGLDITPSTVWEAMPWSWLIDWFTNIGDMFAAERNTIPVSHSGSCVMRSSDTRWIYLGKVSGPGSFSVFPNRSIQSGTRRRVVLGNVAPRAEFNIPFLDGRQLGILASLAVTRRVPTS